MKLKLNHHSLLLFFILPIFFSCEQESSDKVKNTMVNRTELTHSYSNINDIKTTHLHLDIEVDFESNVIYGVARHSMLNMGADTAIFDIKDIEIQKITLGDIGNEIETNYLIGKKDELLGQPLFVDIKNSTKKVNIYYKTTKDSDALDWLPKELTEGKEHPFMYTQGEAILTRSWIPLQDVPSNRITYSANVKVPNELMALMSATNPTQKSNDGEYFFEMNQPVPCYLIALAVGDISYKSLGKNCGIYSEPGLIEECAYEFDDLPKMILAAEKIYGKYQWDRYDLLVLPYSFPFGGMENPRLTFISPTLIAGDRSLVSVIAHELAHSWSGNLVTNASWEDFWLNEGFTVYFENRIMEEIYGKETADVLSYIEFQELQKELNEITKSDFPEDTHLKLNLKGRDPDAGMTSIAYVKGAYFLKTLEETVGRVKFDAFLKAYFKKYAFKTVTTEDFEKYLDKKLLKPNDVVFNTKEWLYKGGLPVNCVSLIPDKFKKVEKLALQISKGERLNKSVNLNTFITQEWLVFIRSLPQDISALKLKEIDERLNLKGCGNSEIMTEWYLLSIKNRYKGIRPDMEKFLLKIGRRKYLQPIYTELSKSPTDLKWAKSVFKIAKNNYHFVSVKTIEEILYGK